MAHTALIVDDSRTALTVLSRMLAARGIVVDTVESGAEALRYLHAQLPPSVVFLDHMMPGMDGFETLGQIKREPLLAGIPVVMYTSQEGEAYLGQAAALGAVGVLRKPVASADVDEILDRLLLSRAGGASAESRTTTLLPPATTHAITGDGPGGMEQAPATGEAQTLPADFEYLAPPARVPSLARRLGRGLLLLGLAATSLWFIQLYREAEDARARAAAETEQLRAQWRERLAAAAASRESAQADTTVAAAAPARAMLETLAWALNRGAGFDYDQPPFNDERAQMLRELVGRLAVAGFRGTVQLETHLGEFCLGRDAQGALVVPPAATPFTGCEVKTYPPGEAVTLGLRQSPRFTRYVSSLNAARGPIEVALVSHGTSRPAQPYPEPDNAHTAGEWNYAARLNQRVEIVLRPAAP